MSLLVSEIFTSIQGESSFQGLPCVFVRLSGCNLRCNYCDTKYAYEDGTEMTVEGILGEVRKREVKLVEITGGEPLLQEETTRLVDSLIGCGFSVLIETNGTVDLKNLNRRAVKIMDIKCPGSGESEHTKWSNLKLLKKRDEVKFVVRDRSDYEWAKNIVEKRKLCQNAKVLFSCVWRELTPEKLATWILKDKLDVRLNLQLHKYIWGEGRKEGT